MKVSKPVLIFGIVILLIAGYVHFFTGKKKPKGPVPPPVQTQGQPAGQTGAPAKPGQAPQTQAPQAQTPAPQSQPQASQQTGPQAPAKPTDAAPVQSQPKPQFDKITIGWNLDPFALPVFKEKMKKEAGSAVRLVAILEKAGARVAVIDKDVVKKGDRIGDEKVAEIGRDRVVLTRGGTKRTLILADPDTMTQESSPTKESSPAKEPLPAKEKATERAK